MVPWNYFDRFSEVTDEYLPSRGEGTSMASQMVTAVNKLIYKWYNDGDVYDNQYFLEGWANDLSSYANWLARYISGCKSILEGIQYVESEDEYSQLLKELADHCLTPERAESLSYKPTHGTIYNCEGPFEFVDRDEYEDDEYYDYDDGDDY